MPEQQNIEWKQSWRDEYLQWISGFANANGGVLYIGKDDNGNVVGLSKYKKLMDELPNKIKDTTGIICAVNLHEENDKQYIEIVVEPSKSLISYRGKFYLRSGSTNQLLSGAALEDFLFKKRNVTWDELTVENFSIKDIDLETMINVVNENKREFEDLRSSQIFKMDILFAKLMANGGYVEEPKNKENFDNLVNEMDDFVDNCIMRATDKYSIENKLHIININNLIQRIKTYKEENLKNIKLNKSSKEISNIHNHIIYYKVENKWFELSCRGLNVVKDDDDKDLNFCINNLNKKDKYRKKNLSFNIRAIKLRYLLNNIKTEFFYLYKEKN